MAAAHLPSYSLYPSRTAALFPALPPPLKSRAMSSASLHQRSVTPPFHKRDARLDHTAMAPMTTRTLAAADSFALDTVSEASGADSTHTVDLDSGGFLAAIFQPKSASNRNGLIDNRPMMHLRYGDSDDTLPDLRDHSSVAESNRTAETNATSINTLPALQTKFSEADLNPISAEDDPSSYDLVAPVTGNETYGTSFSLEARGEDIFSREHLQEIFRDPILLAKFTTFLSTHRPHSIPTLIYYLDALKALRAVAYANAIAEALDPLEGATFTDEVPPRTRNVQLEEKALRAFDLLVQEDLPAYVTYCYIHIVSTSIKRRITGTMPPHLREASEGLAEVFCLSDPSRPDNPIVFSSEEFHRTTQYGVNYAIGRNCRFLQGPRTNPTSVRRLRDAIRAGKEHSETFINYRRDGSPFLNLLMIAPLRDSRGTLRYFIGAQVDVSGLAKDCTQLEALSRMLENRREQGENPQEEKKDEFQQLSEMFNLAELDIVRRHGGKMHREHAEDTEDASWHRPRLLLQDRVPGTADPDAVMATTTVHGKLSGVYQNYLLVRPYPSLRILFASPSLRIPGMLQSPFMNRIGSSERVRDELIAVMAEGRGVTAKIRWVTRPEEEGRNRWIHCTPLLGNNGGIGVWMVVLVDDETSRPSRKFRPAPPVSENIGAGGQQKAREYYDQSTIDAPTRPTTAMNSHSRYEPSSRPATSQSFHHSKVNSPDEASAPNNLNFRVR